MQAGYWSSKAIRKRRAAAAESRLPVSCPILRQRPLTPEELIDKHPAGWMSAPLVKVPSKMIEALKRGQRLQAKAKKRIRYERRYGNGNC